MAEITEMTMLVTGYATKAELKKAVGQRLKYQETSMFGEEYKENGTLYVARRPHMLGGGREFFAAVTMKDGLIAKVE